MNYAEKFSLEFIDVNSPEKTRKRILQSKESKFIDNYEKAYDFASDTSFLLKELYLLEKSNDALQEIPVLCSAVREYLTGDWQNTLPRDGVIDCSVWHAKISWLNNLRDVLMWCSAASNWNSIADTLQFMDSKAEDGKCGSDGKKYYIALRYHFDNNSKTRDTLLSEICSSRNKKYRQLAETFQAILDRDTDTTAKKWNTVFKLWLQQEAKMDWYLAPEPTFLYYFALENGISIPLQEYQKYHIINFEQQKGKH